MLRPIQITPKVERSAGSSGSEGSAKMGQLAGAALGAAAIIGTGGAATPAVGAVLGGAATGSALGGLVGGAADPGKAGTSAMERRLDSTQPQFIHSEKSDALKQSLMALHEAPQEVRNQYGPQLVNAYLSSLHNDNVGGVA
tara:strand:- start:5984 stop:6406 length:423 start_codon:yes stop_codon:yes gene_type:complete